MSSGHRNNSEDQLVERERKLRLYLTVVAVLAFMAAPIILLFIEAFGLGTSGFHLDIGLVGLFVAAVITLLSVRVKDSAVTGALDRFLGKKE